MTVVKCNIIEDRPIRIIKKGLFGVKFLYIDKKTRVRHGFSLSDMGFTYELQRKYIFWHKCSWFYVHDHLHYTTEQIVDYLLHIDRNKKYTTLKWMCRSKF